MALRDLLADRKSDASPRQLALQPPEHLEHLFCILGIEADAVVAKCDLDLAAPPLGADLDAGGPRARELDREVQPIEAALQALAGLLASGPSSRVYSPRERSN